METQHPIDIRIWVKAPDREAAIRVAHERLCNWFTEPRQIIIGYGYPDGTLMLYKVMDENGECKAKPSDPEPDPVVVPDPPQVRFRSDGEKLIDFVCESCHEWKSADELSENPHTTAWVCKSCDLPKPQVEKVKCDDCGKSFPKNEMFPWKNMAGQDVLYCPSCDQSHQIMGCSFSRPLPAAPQGEGNGFDDIDTSVETPAEEHDRLSDRGRN